MWRPDTKRIQKENSKGGSPIESQGLEQTHPLPDLVSDWISSLGLKDSAKLNQNNIQSPPYQQHLIN